MSNEFDSPLMSNIRYLSSFGETKAVMHTYIDNRFLFPKPMLSCSIILNIDEKTLKFKKISPPS